MEQLIRTLSWTFVFGAIATLLYTSFKPFWNEMLSVEIPPDRIQGTMIDAREASPDPDSESVAEAAGCAGNRDADDRCPTKSP